MKITKDVQKRIEDMPQEELDQLVDELADSSKTFEQLGLVNGVVTH